MPEDPVSRRGIRRTIIDKYVVQKTGKQPAALWGRAAGKK